MSVVFVVVAVSESHGGQTEQDQNLHSEMYVLTRRSLKTEQGCIPVGCVLSTAVAVSGGVCPGRCLPRGDCLPRACLPMVGVSAWGGGVACLPGGSVQRGVHLPPVDRILDTCL